MLLDGSVASPLSEFSKGLARVISMNTYDTRQGAEVTEDKDNYYIRIAANDRERAKRIPGRRWDPGILKWICPKTQTAFDAINREFVRSSDLVKIGPPLAPTAPAPQPTGEDRRTLAPAWAGDLTGIPNELNDLRAQSAANAETLDKILEVQKAVFSRISAPEPAQVPQEPDMNAIFSAQLRKLALRAAGNDPSLAALVEETFDVISAPVDLVSRLHQHVEQSLREFVGETDRSVNFPTLVEHAEGLGYFPKSTPIRIAQSLKTMNHLRNLLVHPSQEKGMTRELRAPMATMYFVYLAIVWPYFASEQPLEDGHSAIATVYADGRLLPAMRTHPG